jgi:hypothetical protein
VKRARAREFKKAENAKLRGIDSMKDGRIEGRSWKVHGWVGLAVIGSAEFLLFRKVPFVQTYFTPLVWSGYILFMDALVFRIRGSSLLISRPREFILLLPLSIGLWLIFEFYNLFIQNWHYVGLPEDRTLRLLGYGWAFATIWPAIFETADALGEWRWIQNRRTRSLAVPRTFLILSVAAGMVCLIVPLVAPEEMAPYLAAPVWVGFIFLLDPINDWLGGKSIWRDLSRGDLRVLLRFLLSGFICGWLWEFWNFWAGAKWHYTVPILGELKIFEMPFLGYLGFPAFAVECTVMFEFIRILYQRGRATNG